MKTEAKCVHCFTITRDWDWDHVFPESWYPETTPRNLEKWQVPSCETCNREYGVLENDLMIRVGLCLEPADPRSAGIVEKAKRAIDPDCGKDEKDKAARLAKKKQIYRGISEGDQIPDQGIYPGLGNRWGLPKKEMMSIDIPPASIQRLNEKIIKGIFFLEDKQYVEPPFKISFFAVHEENAGSIKEVLRLHGREYAREPGITVQRAVAPEDRLSSVYFTEIWGQFRMYGSVTRGQSAALQIIAADSPR